MCLLDCCLLHVGCEVAGSCWLRLLGWCLLRRHPTLELLQLLDQAGVFVEVVDGLDLRNALVCHLKLGSPATRHLLSSEPLLFCVLPVQRRYAKLELPQLLDQEGVFVKVVDGLDLRDALLRRLKLGRKATHHVGSGRGGRNSPVHAR
jgi:hypothetical protein